MCRAAILPVVAALKLLLLGLSLRRLDVRDRLLDALMDVLAQLGLVAELEEYLQVHEERREYESYEHVRETHQLRVHVAQSERLLTPKQVIEERGRAALREEVPRELRDPGRDVQEQRVLEALGLARVRGGVEPDDEPLGRVDELRGSSGSEGG